MVRSAANGRLGAARHARPAGAKLLLVVAVLAALAIAFAAALTPAPASAGNDISGEWTFIFQPRPEGSPDKLVCGDVVIVQTGEDLLVSSECWFGKAFAGVFDPVTRYFSIADCSDFCIFVVGTVAEDGNSISGTSGPPHSMISTFKATRGFTPPTPLPSPVGGVAFEPDLGALALQASEPSGSNTGVIVAIPAAAAAFVALAGAVLYAKRRPPR